MSRKQRSSVTNNNNIVELTQALYLNGKAMQEGPKRKNWTIHDLKHIRPLTPTQQEMFEDWFQGLNIVAHGSAGTGKTYVAVYLALRALLDPQSTYDQIIIVRSAVPAREIGFTPGTEAEKLAVYEQPYKDIFADLLGKCSSYSDMKDAYKVKFVSTSFLRGITWDNSLVIIDEAQSCNWHELNTTITRMGNNSRIIICGDHKQNDLIHKRTDQSGISTLLEVTKKMSSFSLLNFTPMDIVRSNFAKQFILACEECGV